MSKRSNPADKVEQWPIEKLVPYAKNSRTHSEDQIAQLAASIKEWGFTSAILVDEDGGIIAGHGRVLAAQSLGLSDAPRHGGSRLVRGQEAGLRHRRQQTGR